MYDVFTTERLFEVAIGSWGEWDLNPRPPNSVQTLWPTELSVPEFNSHSEPTLYSYSNFIVCSVSNFIRVTPQGCTKSRIAHDLLRRKLEKLVFCSVFIYLFVYYLFIQRLFLCLFFIYSNIAACWVMHLLFGLAPFGGGGGGGYFCGVVWRFGGLYLTYFFLLLVWCSIWRKACVLF